MYNRYIPQSDGTYRRNHIPDPSRPPQRSRSQAPAQTSREQERRYPPEEQRCQPEPAAREEDFCTSSKQENRNSHQDSCSKAPPCMQNGSVGSFLKNLLPKEFDTGDLFILLLLLLMAGDCEDDKNTALLTLVLYLFM